MGYELYVITDPTLAGGLCHEEIARLAIEGGADAIQLRDKKCDKQDLVATGRRMRKVTRDANVLFVVNDWLDVALSCGADGVHLGQSDLQVHEARARAPSEFIIGASVSCAADAILAVHQGADYVAASPVFPTASKLDAGAACGIVGIRQIKRAIDVPVVAIGSIGLNNVRDVLEAGADGIAVISAVVAQPDITRAAREMKKRILDSLSSR